MLIPVPGTGGAVVVGESVITFISSSVVRSTAIKPTMVKVSLATAVPGCTDTVAARCEALAALAGC